MRVVSSFLVIPCLLLLPSLGRCTHQLQVTHDDFSRTPCEVLNPTEVLRLGTCSPVLTDRRGTTIIHARRNRVWGIFSNFNSVQAWGNLPFAHLMRRSWSRRHRQAQHRRAVPPSGGRQHRCGACRRHDRLASRRRETTAQTRGAAVALFADCCALLRGGTVCSHTP